MSDGSSGNKGSKNGEIVVGCEDGNVGIDGIVGDAVGAGEMKSLGTELGTVDMSSLGTVDGTMDCSSLGIVDGTKDELGTAVELGVDDSASTLTVTDDGASDTNGDTSLRSVMVLAVESFFRLSDMTRDMPTTAATRSMASTNNPIDFRTIMLKD